MPTKQNLNPDFKFGWQEVGGWWRMVLPGGLSTIMDEEVFRWVSICKWHTVRTNSSGRYYVRRRAREGCATTWVILHRLITNCPDHLHVDHINGDTLDNRRANLRVVTHLQNMQNRPSWTGAFEGDRVQPLQVHNLHSALSFKANGKP